MVERGTVRLTHNGLQTRIDKAARCVHVGDGLIFAIGGHLIDLKIESFGERRGPSGEARALYALQSKA